MKLFRIISVLLNLFIMKPLSAQDITSSALLLLGLSSEEELSEDAMEQFIQLARRPLPLNRASSAELISCGLFSQYQAASVEDYRKSHGDVLSFEELSSLDGFGKEVTNALRPFVSLESGDMVPPRPSFSSELRGSLKSGKCTLRGKTSFEGGAISLYASRSPSSDNFSLAYGRRTLDLVLGDFNARFGQGLVLWNGTYIGGIPSPASLARRPSGLKASTSYGANSFRGIAASLSFSRFRLSALTHFPWLKTVSMGKKADRFSMLSGVNALWHMENGSISLTGTYLLEESAGLRMSADWRFCLGGTDVFGEVAAFPRPAGNMGTCVKVSDWRIALMLRYYPSDWPKDWVGAYRSLTNARDECSVTLVSGDGDSVYGADFSRRLNDGRLQLKLLLSDVFKLSGHLSLKPRLNCRLRTMGDKPRIDLRTDLVCSNGRWSNVLRLNWLHCEGHSGLVSSETSFSDGRLALHLRAMLFAADNWDDRLYAYERGVPGSYSVPALYGRGYRFNAAATWRPPLGRRIRLKTCFSAFYTACPWTLDQEKKKPGSAGLEMSLTTGF